jgi:hypothetical protein
VSDGLLLGIDEGTTTVKVALFDLELRAVAEARRPVPVTYPHPGWVEQDPELILAAVIEARSWRQGLTIRASRCSRGTREAGTLRMGTIPVFITDRLGGLGAMNEISHSPQAPARELRHDSVVEPNREQAPHAGARPSYAMGLADASFEWYRAHAIRSRRSYKIFETLLLVVAACVPTSAVIVPHEEVVPAILGAVVVVLTGLRSIFHWQDNFLRFSGAREAIEAERRTYYTGAKPYNDPATRDQILAAAISRIEQEEMRGWIRIASERPKS